MKLEGAGKGRFRTAMQIGIQDPKVLGRLNEFHDRLLAARCDCVKSAIGPSAGDFHISLRMYGWNAASGDTPPPGTPAPREVGVLFVATAETQDLATQIAKACNPHFLHFPLVLDEELPGYGFAFSPDDIERGPVYEFKLNHVVEVDDPMELVRTRWIDLSKAEAAWMATVQEVSRHIRSKNAGPFWVTIDIFFDGPETFARYAGSPRLGPDATARIFGANAELVKRYPAPSLHMVKISYPRASAQSGEVERDMHCGQQFVRLLDIEID